MYSVHCTEGYHKMFVCIFIAPLTPIAIEVLNLFFMRLKNFYLVVTSSAALVVSIITFLKLISYQQVNRWCREYFSQADEKSKNYSVRRTRSLSHPHSKTGSFFGFTVIIECLVKAHPFIFIGGQGNQDCVLQITAAAATKRLLEQKFF